MATGEIYAPDGDYQYVTIRQGYDVDAHRHMSKALLHSIMGRPSYAAGSALKAIKWLKLGLEYDRFVSANPDSRVGMMHRLGI